MATLETAKRKAEDDDASSSNASGKRRKKSKNSRNDDLPSNRRAVSLDLLPLGEDAASKGAKHQIDHSITVEGIVQSAISYSEDTHEVHIYLASEKPCYSLKAAAVIAIIYRGQWAESLVRDGILVQGGTIALSFKEAKYAQRSDDPSDSPSMSHQSKWQLLFTRGCKLWTRKNDVPETSESPLWTHNCTFSEAQAELSGLDKAARAQRESTTSSIRSRDSVQPRHSVTPIPHFTQESVLIPTCDSPNPNFRETRSPTPGIANRTSTAAPLQDSSRVVSESDNILSGAQGPSDQAIASTSQQEAAYQYSPCCELRNMGDRYTVSTLGVVIAYRPPKIIGSGYYCEYKLIDQSLPPITNDFLYTCFLQPNKDKIAEASVGDVLLVRNFQTQLMGKRSKIVAFPDKDFSWAVWTPREDMSYVATSSQVRTSEDFGNLTQAELDSMTRLARWHHGMQPEEEEQSFNGPGSRANSILITAADPVFHFARPFKLLSTIERVTGSNSDFFDCMVEVVEPMQDYGPRYTVLVTDYTSNRLLSARYAGGIDADAQIIFEITIWKDTLPEHMHAILQQAFDQGNHVFVENLKAKLSRPDETLEAQASLVKYGFRVTPVTGTDKRWLDLVARKEAFQQGQKARTSEAIDDSGFEASDNEVPTVIAPKIEEAEVQPVAAQAVAVVQSAALSIQQPAASTPAQWVSAKTRRPKKLSSLVVPDGPTDKEAFFDCFCEVMQDVEFQPDNDHTILHVTDFTTNTLFQANDLDDYPNGERLKFSLTAFADPRQKQISNLKKGQRVFLRNVRAKYSFGMLEGDIGARGNFAVTVLPDSDAAYIVLGTARDDLIASIAAIQEAEDEEEYAEKPSATCTSVICTAAHEAVQVNAFLQNRKTEGKGFYHLRGRVLSMGSQDLEDCLVTKCQACQTWTSSSACEQCGKTIAASAGISEWRFSMLVELEPDGCNIEKDAVDPTKRQWIIVAPVWTDFTNGLEPTEANIPELKRLLSAITDSPCPLNGTNPIFDFRVHMAKEASKKPPVVVMTDTRLRRD